MKCKILPKMFFIKTQLFIFFLWNILTPFLDIWWSLYIPWGQIMPFLYRWSQPPSFIGELMVHSMLGHVIHMIENLKMVKHTCICFVAIRPYIHKIVLMTVLIRHGLALTAQAIYDIYSCLSNTVYGGP